jgi:alginate O-acetyltransferase complex protein AlgI
MVFSSNLFLFLFLPTFFGLYFLLPKKLQNAFILFSSLVFYWIGAGYFVSLMIFKIVFNYFVARKLLLMKGGPRKALLIAGVSVNLLIFIYFKYMNFFATEISRALSLPFDEKVWSIALPIGISFFTFQALSTLIDAYRHEMKMPGSIIDFGMYLSVFPVLIAGPIVRYVEIEDHIYDRKVTTDGLFQGATRFCFGLAKKVLIADTLGGIVNTVFSMPATELQMGIAWLGVFTYALQIYFDFSAYSDMAIGLGKCLGFNFPENFDNPYRSHSITEFWRRWHMTLSRWFRDYLYIPLGGNKLGSGRTYLNLFVVFTLCGLWHGAAYTFLLWGFYHGALLTLERIADKRFGIVGKGLFGQFLTFFLVLIGWAIFRSEGLVNLRALLHAMFDFGQISINNTTITRLLTPDVMFIYGVAVLLVLFAGNKAIRFFEQALPKGILAVILLVVSCASISGNDFHPFIYFRF